MTISDKIVTDVFVCRPEVQHGAWSGGGHVVISVQLHAEMLTFTWIGSFLSFVRQLNDKMVPWFVNIITPQNRDFRTLSFTFTLQWIIPVSGYVHGLVLMHPRAFPLLISWLCQCELIYQYLGENYFHV